MVNFIFMIFQFYASYFCFFIWILFARIHAYYQTCHVIRIYTYRAILLCCLNSLLRRKWLSWFLKEKHSYFLILNNFCQTAIEKVFCYCFFLGIVLTHHLCPLSILCNFLIMLTTLAQSWDNICNLPMLCRTQALQIVENLSTLIIGATMGERTSLEEIVSTFVSSGRSEFFYCNSYIFLHDVRLHWLKGIKKDKNQLRR